MLQTIESINNVVNNFIWGVPAMICIIGVGLYLSLRTGFVQIRKFPYALKTTLGRIFKKKEASDGSMTPFQAVCTALAGTVGTGNIAGVAGAIAIGGPGAVFWMWVSALLGMCTKFTEVTLAVHFRERNRHGDYVGGPMYYIKNGLGKNWRFLAVLYSAFGVLTVFGTGNATQVNTITTAIDTALINFNVISESSTGRLNLILGIVITLLVGMVLLGGIKRIGQVAEFLAPIMCGIYLLVMVIIMIVNAERIPSVFGSIFASAFGKDAVFGGIVGSALSWGIKRGFFSNDAGNGMSPLISATTDTSHPVKQGLVQGFSVYVDTLLVCTCTGLSVLLAGTYNVAADGVGDVLLVEHAKGIQYGIAFMQEAMATTIGQAGAMLLAVILFIFIFTTMLSYSYQLESTCKYLFGENKWVVTFVRILFLIFCMFGILIDGDTIWPMGDIGVGCMLWVNTFSILLLTPVLMRIVKDYEKQRAQGLNPLFDPATVGIEDEAGVWNQYVEEKKKRGDYENPALGYEKKN